MLLSDIVGHARPIDALVRAHVGGTSHHAYLFQGPAGVGKRHVAFALAALWSCVGPRAGVGVACGTCRHCRRILPMADVSDDGGHPDLRLLEPDGRQIKVDQVRELLRIVPFPPIEAAVRAVIIDPADALGEEAANALLKTLEEPSSRTRFILLTSRPAALLTTIKSRCQRVGFGRLTDAQLAAVLTEREGWAPEDAQRVVPLADGSVGAALALRGTPVADKGGQILEDFLNAPAGDAVAAFGLAGALNELLPTRAPSGEKIRVLLPVLDRFARLLRDALILRVGGGQRLYHAELRAPLEAWAARYGTSAILARLEVLAEARLGLATFNTNPRLTLERLFLALTAPPGREAVRPLIPNTEIL